MSNIDREVADTPNPTLAEMLDEPKNPTIDGEDAVKERRRAHLEDLSRRGRLMRGEIAVTGGSDWIGRLRKAWSMSGGKKRNVPQSDMDIVINSSTVIPATKKP